MTLSVLVLLGDGLCLLVSVGLGFLGYCLIAVGADILPRPRPDARVWTLMFAGLLLIALGCGGLWALCKVWQHQTAWSLTSVRLGLPAHAWLAFLARGGALAGVLVAGALIMVHAVRCKCCVQPQAHALNRQQKNRRRRALRRAKRKRRR